MKKLHTYIQLIIQLQGRIAFLLILTHYSFVVYFLIRKIPEFIIKLQNGVFGPAERIVRSFESAWDLNVNQGPDLKELIPE